MKKFIVIALSIISFTSHIDKSMAGSNSPTVINTWGSSSTTNTYHNYSISNTSQQIFASGSRNFLDLSGQNSLSNDIWCNFSNNQVAMINPTAGNDSFRIAAGGDDRWENSFIPSDAVQCVSISNTTLYASQVYTGK